MVKANQYSQLLDMIESVESYTLQTYHDTLCLTERLKDCEAESPNKPPFALNYLEYYNCSEPVTSWIIRHLFAYTFKGKHPFFESFVKRFLQDIGFNLDWIDTPIINKDHEYKSIDILIRDKRYAIIIENKLKGAEFQRNQLARYIAIMRCEGYSDNQIFVVVLPNDDKSTDDINESVWNLPPDWQSTSQTRRCRVDSCSCWCDYDDFIPKRHCEKCEPLRDAFEGRTLFIHKDLSDWLYDSIVHNTLGVPDEELRKQYVLVSAALQFVDYLNSIYETRENDKFKMDIQKFLSEQLKLNDIDIVDQFSIIENKQDDVKELSTQLDALYRRKVKEFISERGKRYNVHIVLEENQDYYFHCEFVVDGKVVILSVNYKERNCCQIKTKSRRRLPDCIVNDFEIAEELNDAYNNRSDCICKYDEYLQCLLRFDRVLARLLEIKDSYSE